MARPKKDYTAVSVRLDNAVYERLSKYCEESGQSKTVAVERALSQYIDEFDEEQKLIDELKQKRRTQI